MTTFPKYDRYKDSGVEWLGEVPEHWKVCRNLGVFDERKECNTPEAEMLSVTVGQGIIRQSEIITKKDSSNDDKSKYKVVRVGDLAYNKMRAWQGALGVSAYEGIVSPAYVVLSPRNRKLSKYFHYLFRTPQFITEANRLSYGLCDDMNSLRYEHFKTSASPIPPDDEIDRIVAFLDQKTAEIDALIAKKQRQIELLDEQKAILINRAVTRGLNPNAKLKPSGIEWIGEIPEHWKVKKFRYCAQIRGGQVDPRKEPYKSAVLIAPDHIESGTARILGLVTAKAQGAESGKYQVQAGDLIYSKIRPNLRKACIAPVDCLCSADMYAITTSEELLPKFLLGYMLSEGFTKAAVDAAMRVAMPKVNREALADFPVVLPPVDEQRLIFSWLEEFDVNRGKALNSIESQIDSLKTLRSTLIAHAVTGRVKV
jgi:type I restriction enzyme S subunit